MIVRQKPSMPGRGLIGPLLLTVAGLGGLNWWLLTAPMETGPLPSPEPAAEPSGTASTTVPPELVLPALPELGATLARPLFSADRRPPKVKVEPVAAVPVAAPADGLRLAGVVLLDGEGRALLRDLAGGPASWVVPGEEFQGWQLTEVHEDHVVLAASGQQRELWLYDRAAPSGGAPSQ